MAIVRLGIDGGIPRLFDECGTGNSGNAGSRQADDTL